MKNFLKDSNNNSTWTLASKAWKLAQRLYAQASYSISKQANTQRNN